MSSPGTRAGHTEAVPRATAQVEVPSGSSRAADRGAGARSASAGARIAGDRLRRPSDRHQQQPRPVRERGALARSCVHLRSLGPHQPAQPGRPSAPRRPGGAARPCSCSLRHHSSRTRQLVARRRTRSSAQAHESILPTDARQFHPHLRAQRVARRGPSWPIVRAHSPRQAPRGLTSEVSRRRRRPRPRPQPGDPARCPGRARTRPCRARTGQDPRSLRGARPRRNPAP